MLNSLKVPNGLMKYQLPNKENIQGTNLVTCKELSANEFRNHEKIMVTEVHNPN